MKKLFIGGAVIISMVALASSRSITANAGHPGFESSYLDTIPKKDSSKKRPLPKPDSPPSLHIIKLN